MASKFTHSIREFELERTIDLLPSDCRLLEIGAGDGWQASKLKHHCRLVNAIDISNSKNLNSMHFLVTHYDGKIIPFENHSFDVIYSSNVLEHVENFTEINDEINRVLRPGGLSIHCVPSSTWRIWTSIGHPFYVTKWAYKFAKMRFGFASTIEPKKESIAKLNWWKLALLMLFSPRHGESGSMVSEIWLFSRRHWERQFIKHGWQVINYRPSNIFYTGNEILGLKIRNFWRSMLSRFLGSSSHIFVLRKK